MLVIFGGAIGTHQAGTMHSAYAQSADPKADARRHFKAGLDLMKVEDWPGAVAAFETSVGFYANVPNLYNLANGYKATHRYGEALTTLRRLQSEFGSQMGEDVVRDVRTMVEDIQRIVARVLIRVDPPRAQVSIDGRPIASGDLATPFVLGPGDHEIRVTLEGFSSATRSVRLSPGTSTTETFSLEPLAGRVSIQSVPEGASVSVDGRPVGVTPIRGGLDLPPGEHTFLLSKGGYESVTRTMEVRAGATVDLDITLPGVPVAPLPPPVAPRRSEPAPVRDEGSHSSGASTWAWFSLTGTVLAGAGTLVAWRIAEGHVDDYKTYDSRYVDPTLTDPAEIETYRDRRSQAEEGARSANAATLGCGVATGVFAVLTVVLFATTGDNPDVLPKASSGSYGFLARF